jgi:hypothetical protein
LAADSGGGRGAIVIMQDAQMARREALTAEARRIGRYFLGEDPPEDLVDRYREASLVLFPGTPDPADGGVLDFVHRHPWSLPLLESALGLLRPQALLRRKTVVMMAVLETDPRFADRFEAHCPGRAGAIVRLSGLGLSSAVKIVGGLLLYPLARLLGARTSVGHDGVES